MMGVHPLSEFPGFPVVRVLQASSGEWRLGLKESLSCHLAWVSYGLHLLPLGDCCSHFFLTWPWAVMILEVMGSVSGDV